MKIIEQSYDWAYKPGTRTRTTDLILHHSAGRGSAQSVHEYHISLGWAGIAYHYYIRMDGTIFRGRPENWLGGHTTNYNYCSLGICFEGNFQGVDEMPQAQRDAGRELVADIVKRYPAIRVGLHKEYNLTSCPGSWFPAEEIIRGRRPAEPEDANPEDGVDPPAWAQDACDLLVDMGIFRGDGTSFRWGDPITRAELAVVLSRVLESMGR